MCSNMISTIVDVFFFPPICLVFNFALTHSAHSRFMHTQPQLFVYAGIFSNRASEGYTAGGKHRARRWSAGVLSLLFVYRSSPCSLHAGEINDGWRQFQEESTSPLIEIRPGVLTQKYQNIVVKPIFKNIAHIWGSARNWAMNYQNSRLLHINGQISKWSPSCENIVMKHFLLFISV